MSETAGLLGLTLDGARKRAMSGKFDVRTVDGVLCFNARQIEEERTALLRRLDATDARPGAAAGDEVSRLRAEVVRLRATAESLLLASRAAHDAVQANLLPSTPDG